MKRILIINLIILFCLNVYSQESEKKLYVSISIGQSNPFGTFSHKKSDKFGTGFTENGQTAKCSFDYWFGEDFGFTFSLMGAEFSFDEDNYEKYLGYSDQLDIDANKWRYGTVYLGVFKSISYYHISGYCSVSVGGMLATRPEITIKGLPSISELKHKRTSASSLSFNLAIGLRYKFTDKISFFAVADWVSARPKFKVTIDEDAASNKKTIKQPINTMNLTAGVSYWLR